MIEIRRYESELLSSNMYVVSEDGHAIVIDPSKDVSVSTGLTVDEIILTHEHYDHISGVNAWKEAVDAPVLCSRACGKNIQDPRKNLSRYFRDFCELQTWIEIVEIPPYDPDYSCSADEVFDDALSFDWQGHRWDLFELPGHSPGSIGILLDRQFFFSGDSLLENSEISLRFPGGSRKKWESAGLPRLNSLAQGIRVYPGHFGDFIYIRK